LDTTVYNKGYVLHLLRPETETEAKLIEDPLLLKGLFWGEARYGHPEGKVLYHVAEIFENIEEITPKLTQEERKFLRIIALVHDSCKYAEDKNDPRDWSKHHGILAAKFMSNYTDNERILSVLALHDEAYYCWRLCVLNNQPEAGMERFKQLMNKVEHFLQSYYLFFKCDTRTGDKTQAPVKWFEKTVTNIKPIEFILQ
jgi:hypothetical protein